MAGPFLVTGVRHTQRNSILQNLDFEDNTVSELVGRQMSAMSALRSMVGFETPDAPRKPFSGWKVKIEYEADIPIFSIICNHNQTYTLTAVGVATVVSLGRSIIKH